MGVGMRQNLPSYVLLTTCSLLSINYASMKFSKNITIDPVPVKKPFIFSAEDQEDPHFLAVKEHL